MADDSRLKMPAYQWYPKDHRTDEKVELMDLEQEGALRRLLDHQWLQGSIPADADDLAGLLRVDEERFARIWKRVGPCFEPVEGDPSRLVNRRLERERQQRAKYSEARAEAGRKGALGKWQKDGSAIDLPLTKERQSHSSANGKAIAQPKQNDGSAIPEPMAKNGTPDSILQNTEAIASDAEASPGPASPADRKPNEAWEEVSEVLGKVCDALGWEAPLPKDIRRRLRDGDALRELVQLYGRESTAEMFVWAHRNWRGQVSWEAVFDKRNQVRQAMEAGEATAGAGSNGKPMRPVKTIEELEEANGWR